MARYIDADKALEFIKETNANYHWLLAQYSAHWVYDFIESQPDADVVPKSEVERLQAEVTTLMNDYAVAMLKYENAKREVAKVIFAEIVKILNSRYAETQHTLHGLNTDTWFAIEQHGKLVGITQIGDDLAELKKKYTVDQT